MSSTGNQLLQGPSGSPNFAVASWENGDGETISDFSLDNSLPGKYKTTVSNILSKHCNEVKLVSDEITNPIASISKKKLKDLVTKHNNEIFNFLSRPDKTPQVIGLAETIFRRYGHEVPHIKGSNSASILRELNLDVSLDSTIESFDEGLKNINGGGGLDNFLKQTRWIFNQYKNIGEEVIRLETILFQKIEMLDKLNNRTPMLMGLTNNEVLPELIDTFAKYAESVFKTTQIEDTYKELVETYKKWNICRQIIALHHNFKTDKQEPLCPICLTDTVATVLVPCGHTFCSNCIKKQNTTCYMCRGTIRERVKLYLG
jgi:hypothetical protein